MQIYELTRKVVSEAGLASTAYNMAKDAAIDYIAKKTNRSRSFYQPSGTTTPPAPAADTTTPPAPTADTTTPPAPTADTTTPPAPTAGMPAAPADTGIFVNPRRRIRVVDPKSKGVYFKTQQGWVNELNQPVAAAGVAYLERLADQGLGREENIPPAIPQLPAKKSAKSQRVLPQQKRKRK